jgi:hypothetical protein
MTVMTCDVAYPFSVESWAMLVLAKMNHVVEGRAIIVPLHALTHCIISRQH